MDHFSTVYSICSPSGPHSQPPPHRRPFPLPRPPQPSYHAGTCCLPPLPIDGKLLRSCKRGALQFVVLKPFLALTAARRRLLAARRPPHACCAARLVPPSRGASDPHTTERVPSSSLLQLVSSEFDVYGDGEFRVDGACVPHRNRTSYKPDHFIASAAGPPLPAGRVAVGNPPH